MKKIPSVFMRNYDGDRRVRDEVVPGCEWVLAGEGVPTIKWDGSCVMVRDGEPYKRYDAKPGRKPPEGWEPCEPEPDPVTGHHPGWIKCKSDNPADKWYLEAFLVAFAPNGLPDGTYEAVGPHFQANPYGGTKDTLVRHGGMIPGVEPVRTFEGIRKWCENNDDAEGLVFHHPDGRMAKVKRKDFGFPWPPAKPTPSGGAT